MAYKIKNSRTEFGEKVLAQGQADDLISDTGKIRVWRSRIDNSISMEELKDGRWVSKE